MRKLMSINPVNPTDSGFFSFSIIQPDSGTTPVAEQANDTLTMTSANTALTIAGTAATDTITFTINTIPVTLGGTGTATQFTSGSVVFADGSGVYSQDNTNFFWDITNRRLGIGLATPAAKIDILNSSTNATINSVLLIATRTDARVNGFVATVTPTYTTNQTFTNSGFQTEMRAIISSGITQSGLHYGGLFTCQRNINNTGDKGTLDTLVGLRSNYGHNNTDATSAPITNTVYGIFATPSLRGTGTITNFYDVYIDDDTSATVTPTNRYSLYNNSAAASYIKGNLGIGATTATAQLHTTGTVRLAAFGAGIATFSATGVVSSTATTGSGSVVLGTSPTIATATISSPTITTPTMVAISNLTTNGYVKTSGGIGTLGVQAIPIPATDGGTGATTTFTIGSVVFAGTSGVYTQDNANFFWDDTNNRLGIGTTTPLSPLQLKTSDAGTATVVNLASFSHSTSGTAAASFGSSIDFRADSATVADRQLAIFLASWVSATDATRTSQILLQGYQNGAVQTFFRANRGGLGGTELFGIETHTTFASSNAIAGIVNTDTTSNNTCVFTLNSENTGKAAWVGSQSSNLAMGTGAGTQTSITILNATNFVGVGLTAPASKLHVDAGTATASYLKFTANATTGQLSTDGFDVGIDSSGNAEIRQREALDIVIYANNTEAARVKSAGNIVLPTTVTAGGTTGNQTINKTTGTVNFAAAATQITVTNSLVSATSIVLAVVRTNDTTATIKNVVPSAGSFVITLTAGATAETSVGFVVIN